MTRTWKMFGLQTVLAVALAAAPVARAEDSPTIKDIDRRLQTIEKALAEIQRSADAVVNEGLKYNALAARVKTLEERMGQLEAAVGALQRAAQPAPARVSAYPPDTLDDVKARLDRIERMLSGLDRTARVARAAPSTGRILLTNEYPEDMFFTVNGVSYTLAPNTSRLLDGQPAGAFTYSVFSPRWGERARKTTTLLPGDTYRITVD